MNAWLKKTLSAALAAACCLNVSGKETVIDLNGKIRPETDITEFISGLLENIPKNGVTVIFPQGRFFLSPDFAGGKYLAITNHDNGYKNIAFDLDGFTGLEIKGNGTEFIFEGFILPFHVSRSADVCFSGFSIDWKYPLYIQGEIVGSSEKNGYYDVRFEKEGYDWKLDRNGKICFPSDRPYSSVGESLIFDKALNAPVFGAQKFDVHRKGVDVRTEKRENGIIRIHESLKACPPKGSIINFKGPNGENRYSPAFHVTGSRDIHFDGIVIRHAPGMGILCEKTENVSLDNVKVTVPEGSGRTVSTTADATHFCNCKGSVTMDNCLFENMLDDGTNVHGTYVEVTEIRNGNTVRVKLRHPQQAGFEFAEKGDEIYFLSAPVAERNLTGKAASVREINEIYSDITFEHPVPSGLKPGDVLENKTWNTSLFCIRNSVIQNNRARNIVIKAPGKVILSGNRLSSMMSSILIRNEMSFWYESSAVEDVLIENNTFGDCVTGCSKAGVIMIVPRTGAPFTEAVHDRNIRIVGNVFNTFDNIIVQAENVDGLVIKGNRYTRSNTYPAFNKDEKAIQTTGCTDVEIRDNNF